MPPSRLRKLTAYGEKLHLLHLGCTGLVQTCRSADTWRRKDPTYLKRHQRGQFPTVSLEEPNVYRWTNLYLVQDARSSRIRIPQRWWWHPPFLGCEHSSGNHPRCCSRRASSPRDSHDGLRCLIKVPDRARDNRNSFVCVPCFQVCGNAIQPVRWLHCNGCLSVGSDGTQHLSLFSACLPRYIHIIIAFKGVCSSNVFVPCDPPEQKNWKRR